MELENNGKLTFLGMMINGNSPRPETKVYAKTTDTGLLLHHQSHVDEKYKLSLLRIMLNRVFSLLELDFFSIENMNVKKRLLREPTLS